MNGAPPGPPQQMNGPPQQMNGPPQQMNGPPQQVYMQQPQPSQVMMMGPPPFLGFEPQRMTCPYCQVDQSTNCKYECGMNATIWAVVLCFTGLWCCALYPMLSDNCKDVHHSCANCNRVIGVSKRGC